MSFVKLTLKIDVPKLPDDSVKLVFTAGNAEREKYRYAGERGRDAPIATNYMYSIPQEIAKHITSQLPEQFFEKETPSVHLMRIVKGQGTQLPPHVDRGRRVAVNIYLQCGDERTVFYSDKDGELVEHASYVAKAGEVWVLDVSKPHAVLFGNYEERSVITIGYRKTRFSDLKKQLIRVQND